MSTFEALVAEIAARFLRRFDPARDAAGSPNATATTSARVFLVQRSRYVAQLRLLLVEPSARGSGIGRRLVGECIAFARRTGYHKVMLWTNAGLDAARHLYDDAGFRLVARRNPPELRQGPGRADVRAHATLTSPCAAAGLLLGDKALWPLLADSGVSSTTASSETAA